MKLFSRPSFESRPEQLHIDDLIQLIEEVTSYQVFDPTHMTNMVEASLMTMMKLGHIRDFVVTQVGNSNSCLVSVKIVHNEPFHVFMVIA